MDKKDIAKTLAWVSLVGAVFILITWVPTLFTDAKFTGLARTVQALGTITAIFAGGGFAYYKLQMFRDFAPHLTISHKVTHRLVGESYVHIAVAATLYNSSRVKLELREGIIRLQQIGPVSDEEVETLYAQVFIHEEVEDIRWTTLEEVRRGWKKGELIIEPGESHQETYEFIMSKDVESVLIDTYFYNPHSSTPEGWGATTVHDIVTATDLASSPLGEVV